MKTIIVAGCIRSGLTLMMQMLDKGGYPCYGSYPAYEDYGFGKIDYKEANQKAIKVVDTHRQLPPADEYYVIRLRRDLKQQSKSIIKFIRLIGIPIDNSQLRIIKKSLIKDYKIIDQWANKQKSMITIDFEELINNPKLVIEKINSKFNISIERKAIECVVKRDTKCYNGMLETQFIN